MLQSASLAFSPGEFARRHALLNDVARDVGADAVLVDQTDTLAWATGAELSESLYRACVFPLDGAPRMVVRSLDVWPFRRASWIEATVSYLDWEDPLEALAAALREMGLKTVALDPESYCMPAARLARLAALAPEIRFVEVADFSDRLRLVKSEEEIAYLRKAASIGDAAMRRAIAVAGAGASERAPAAEAARAFIELGADPERVGPVTRGDGWAFLHGTTGDAALAEGDILHLELVPRLRGYSARLMRSVVVGAASAEQREVFAALVAAQDAQIAAMVPGTQAREADALLRDEVLRRGLRESYDNITGYTLGLYARSGPRTSDFTLCLHPRASWRFEASQVFHVYASAQGLAVSETVLIGERGSERLTRLERVLFETDCGAS